MIELPFDSPLSAMTYLEQQGNTVIFATPLPPAMGALVGMVNRFLQQPVTQAEMAESLTNVSVMLKAGVPLITAIRDAIGEHDNKTLARIGRELVLRVESGSSFTDACARYPQVFPDTIRFLIRLGEETGGLDRTVKDAADHAKKMDRIKKDTKSALTYPTFMFIAIFGAMFFWVYLVVPPMADLFKSFRVPLPAMTVIVIGASKAFAENIGTILAVGATAIFSLSMAIKLHQPTRRGWHWLLLRIPVFKLIVSSFNLAFITEYMSLMINAGVDIMRSLQILKEALPNEIYREKLDMVRERLVQGVSLRESFTEAKIFPTFVVRMIGVGEQSGTLSDQLEYVAEEYRLKLDDIVANIGKLVEPLAIMIGGGMFIVLAMALFSPLYYLIKSI
ncbi:putative type II secretion system protein [Magnetofaba australis IT-1]|uniref:Putative type II secretion system protein n=2 Tax=Magnetofaba TaxID=1472292 RepID=A0A1Y2K4K6_9PROT|nr:putative type II secretion system protein [Magnetofaba australis IT-1]